MTDTFTYTDPRELDGDPYVVAGQAVAQANAAVALASRAVADANVMARNAQMERETEPDAAAWPGSAQGLRYAWISEQLALVTQLLTTLRRVASFNPKHPPKVDSQP